MPGTGACGTPDLMDLTRENIKMLFKTAFETLSVKRSAPRGMARPKALYLAVLASVILTACAASNKPKYAETFSDTNTYSRTYPASGGDTCEAARRALLSQGYTIGKAEAQAVDGVKNFQGDGEKHMQLSIHVVCAADGKDGKNTTAFVNAVQDHYIVKKNSSSAGVGLSVLGSVSMPFGSSDDSLAKVASETISSSDFYDGFFELMARYLPKQGEPAPSVSTPAPPVSTPAATPPQAQDTKDSAAKDAAQKEAADKEAAQKEATQKDAAPQDPAPQSPAPAP